ncbi:MAG: hypothetical protein QM708_07395 [Propioniciclava sp.]|uniref:hypothetical protein n=1 Tax=Propioniciclava sp. TaxID=2038686 RepID=UPI0039E49E96
MPSIVGQRRGRDRAGWGTMDAMARFLVSYPCEDACGEIETDRRVEGAPVYRCPGCDSEWIEEHERTDPAPPAKPAGSAEASATTPDA